MKRGVLMSYEIVSKLRLDKNENGWYAVCSSCSNNVYPHTHYEWTWGKDKGLTKEQVQADILLNFYHGNLKGGKNTRFTDKISHDSSTIFAVCIRALSNIILSICSIPNMVENGP